MDDFPLILASGSPRRAQLLREAGYPFEVIEPSESVEVEASKTSPTIAAQPLVARLAFLKAQDVASRVDRGIVIACDTVAECEGRILGKPTSRDDAREMLRLLRGKEHRVYSGLCLWRRPDDERRVQTEMTKLIMQPLSDADLESYLNTGQWEGKAGAFGYQDGLDWVHVLEGSESNVVGLPMELFAKLLEGLETVQPG